MKKREEFVTVCMPGETLDEPDPPSLGDPSVAGLRLQKWMVEAMQRKWYAGAREHKGGPGDFRRRGFDFAGAMAAEALDALNYYAAARVLVGADERMERAARKFAEGLEMLGAGAVEGIAETADA